MHDLLAFTIVGIVTGAIYAVAASGLVVTYTTSGIFNFAHGAIGMFGAFAYWELRVNQHMPAPIALFLVLIVGAPLLGALMERIFMRGLYGKPTGVAIVVTVALMVALLSGAQTLWKQTGTLRRLPEFFAGNDIELFGVRVAYHKLIVIAVAIAIAAGLRFLLFHTRTGVTMRAVVDNKDLAGMNGIIPERVAQLSWAIGASLAALAGILIAPQLSMNHLLLTLLVVNGFAAAMLGRLKNLPLTFVGALILGLAQAFLIGYGGKYGFGDFKLIQLSDIVPTIFLLAILIFLPQVKIPAGRLVGAAPPRVPSARQTVIVGSVFVALMMLLSTMLSEFWLFNLSMALVLGIVMLSLVLLSGFAGQISLMQLTFVGVGAVTVSRIVSDGSIFGIILAGLISAAVGAIVAIPALRLQELYLALTTVALAVVGDWAFNRPEVFSVGGAATVKRLHILGVRFRSEESQLILVAIAFVLIALLVMAIRRGAYGRRLAALRDSPVAASMLGMNLVAAKTTVFALSAGIAGIAGALFGGLQVTISANDFLMFKSLGIFLVASFGGLTTVVGALFGGAFLALLPELAKRLPGDSQLFQNFGIAIGAIALADNPHGFGGNISMAGQQIRNSIAKVRKGSGRSAASAGTSGVLDVTNVEPVREEVGVG
jgi:branched-chain amino acid transport system permease protein